MRDSPIPSLRRVAEYRHQHYAFYAVCQRILEAAPPGKMEARAKGLGGRGTGAQEGAGERPIPIATTGGLW